MSIEQVHKKLDELVKYDMARRDKIENQQVIIVDDDEVELDVNSVDIDSMAKTAEI